MELLYFPEKAFLIFRELEIFSPKLKKFQVPFYAWKMKKKNKKKKTLWKNFLYIGKWNFVAPKSLMETFETLNKTFLYS